MQKERYFVLIELPRNVTAILSKIRFFCSPVRMLQKRPRVHVSGSYNHAHFASALFEFLPLRAVRKIATAAVVAMATRLVTRKELKLGICKGGIGSTSQSGKALQYGRVRHMGPV